MAAGRLTRRVERARTTLRVIKRSLGLVWSASARVVVGTTALQVVTGLGTVGVVVFGGRLAERMLAIPDEGSDGIGRLIVGFVVVMFVTLVASLVENEYQVVLAERTERLAVDVVLGAAVSAELEEYESAAFHDELVLALYNATSQPAKLTWSLLGLVSSGVAAAGLGTALVVFSPRVFVIVVVGTIPLWWTARRATRLSYEFEVAQSSRDRRRDYFLMTLASRTHAGEIRAFGIGDELRERVRSVHGRRIDELLPVIRRRSWLAIAGATISVVLGGIVLISLVDLFESGSVGVDEAAVATVAFLVLTERLQTFNASAASVLGCTLLLEDLDRFGQRTLRRATDRSTVEKIETIRLSSVGFTYPAGDAPAVRDVDLELRRGELVALVGENGSGKSTVAHLLALLYQPSEGVVRVNGEPVDTTTAPGLRKRIAVVQQEYMQLMVSAAENIGFGDLDALDDRERIVDAARIAEIHNAIEALKLGYDTMLGTEFSGGQELSGGQWQRLAIARAWFRDADVVILDEPSSALDPQAEVDLINRIRAIADDKIVVLISHRFGTVSQADRIVVLHEGAVVEDGSHQQLMSDDGVYARLYSLQAETFGR